MQDKYWTDILKRDIGVQLELVPASEDKYAALLAAHDFPDVVVFKTLKECTDAIAANLLLCLDDNQDKLPDMYANITGALQYYRDNVSNGTGKLYALPNDSTTQSVTSGDVDYGPYVRWDLYKQLGMPKLNTMEDYLPMLKQMQDLTPTTSDGQKIYGISQWNDWDGNYMQFSDDYANFNGAYVQNGFAQIDPSTKSVTSMFDDNSMYYQSLHFLFSANQLGVLDPDSMTQGWNDAIVKQNAGRTLFSFWNWGYGTFNTPDNQAKGIGFMPVYYTNEKFDRTTGPMYTGGIWPMGIAASSKNSDAAFRYLNYLSSYQGMMLLANGDQGVYWNLDQNGKPYKTELGWQMDQDPTLNYPNGGRPGDGLSVINSFGLDTRDINPLYGVTINSNGWQQPFMPPDTALVTDWKNTMDCQNGTVAYLKQKGILIESPFAPMPPLSDDDAQLCQQIGNNVKSVSWQMVYAKDQNEFDSLWSGMVDQAKGMGVDQVVTDVNDMYQQALAMGSKYSN